MEAVLAETPQERVRRFVLEYATQVHGVPAERASAAAVVCDIMFDDNARDSDRLKAADMVLRYSEAPVRAQEMDQGDTGPEYVVEVMGACDIKGRPLLDEPQPQIEEGELVEEDTDTE